MSFLKNIFGASETEKPTSNLNWNHLEDLGQLDEVIQVSTTKPVLIFKHSTTCSISRMAFKNFENEFDLSSEIEIYYLDLLNFRAISNEIASRFEVVHQSPQILLIKNGECIFNTSHENIYAAKLKDLV
jgi:bacillithiol system protein YtxJ